MPYYDVTGTGGHTHDPATTETPTTDRRAESTPFPTTGEPTAVVPTCEELGMRRQAADACCAVLKSDHFKYCEAITFIEDCIEGYCSCFGDEACMCPTFAKVSEKCRRDTVPACIKEES